MHRQSFPPVNRVNAVTDPENKANRLVWSSFRRLEARAHNRGLSFKYVRQGEEEYCVAGKHELVRAGEFLLVGDKREVEVSIKSSEAVQGICIYLDLDLLREVGRTAGESPESLLDTPTGSDFSLEHLFEAVYPLRGTVLAARLEELSGQTTFIQEDPAFFFCLAEAFFQHLHEADRIRSSLPAERRSTREELTLRLYRSLEYIHDRWNANITLDDMARAACLSPYHFLRTFRRGLGCTPHQYLKKLRMERAAKLLRSESHSVSEVALACGIEDLPYFSRLFKSYHGVSPSRF